MLEHEEYGKEWPDIIIEQYFLTLLCNTKFTTKAVIENFWFDENADEVSRVISHFSGGKPLGGDFTRGLYYRGVM